ncbi:NAD-dependent epimerase/dehydratase family protein [Vibrio genomosp. F10]|uniref:NAD-dependent epimerase/dehydratase family protein n=1 Tax=Vibrio genomosp. F10 TaxID=723171 RepID=UPI0002EA2C51|nr:NAD(P)-dependent oxidoreductase [Vibrio genomosp. F10]OEE96209.1 epimerase [Vibrio genomosp. F10 str. 9ZD137]OEF06299.1 epimerase [Vibrio genomosp. F10 str. 9ZB36]
MNILITGASGFIGTHLIRELATQGHRIFALDILPAREQHAHVDYITADVRDLSQLTISEPIDRIYNFAAVHTTPGHEDIEYFDTNIFGALEVTKFAKQHAVNEIIFTSSISVYGPNEESRTELSPLTPNSAYGFSKAQAEKIHQSWAQDDQTRTLTIVRPAVVFGEGEGGNFTRLAKVLRKGYFPFPGRKDTIKACIYVKELLAAIAFVHQSNLSDTSDNNVITFNGAFSTKYNIEQIVDTFTEVSFPNVKKVCIPKQLIFGAAKLISYFKGFGLGINPERITKLVRSTNINADYLSNNGYTYRYTLKSSLADWADSTSGRYL